MSATAQCDFEISGTLLEHAEVRHQSVAGLMVPVLCFAVQTASAMREPTWCESLRWQLLSLSDWFAQRRMWRTSIAIDRVVLAIYRRFTHCVKTVDGGEQ